MLIASPAKFDPKHILKVLSEFGFSKKFKKFESNKSNAFKANLQLFSLDFLDNYDSTDWAIASKPAEDFNLLLANFINILFK